MNFMTIQNTHQTRSSAVELENMKIYLTLFKHNSLIYLQSHHYIKTWLFGPDLVGENFYINSRLH